MPKTANIHVRMDEQIKEDALKVFEGLGISVAEAITIYFRQVAINRGIPFDLAIAPTEKSGVKAVSAYKQDDLQAILEILPASVDELWVFGSAVTPFCKPDSDLDVCIVSDNITKDERRTILHAPRRAMDLLVISKDGFNLESKDRNSVYYQIRNNGVLVYRKERGVING